MMELPPNLGEMMAPIDAAFQAALQQAYGQPVDQPDSFYLKQQAAAQKAALIAQLQQSLAPLAAAVAGGQQVGFQGQFLPPGRRPTAPMPVRTARAGPRARIHAIMAALAGNAAGFTQVRDPGAAAARAGFQQVHPPANAGFHQVQPPRPAWTQVQPKLPWMLAR